MTTALVWLHWMSKNKTEHPCLEKSIWEQPNTVIGWIRHKSLYQACNHLVSFLLVTQITDLKKSSKGDIYEESLDQRSASTCWITNIVKWITDIGKLFTDINIGN